MSRKASGFTLMEMLIVVTIIAVLAGVGVSYYADYIEEARIATARNNLKVVRNAISRYFQDHMTYPQTLESLLGPYLLQPVDALLKNPLAGNGIIMVEVVNNVHYPDDYNVFQATSTMLIDYNLATHNNRQIKNIRLKYNGSEMNW